MSEKIDWKKLDQGERAALVAEKVMGWKRDRFMWVGELNSEHCVRLAEDIEDIYQPESAWSPSSNISDAMEVILGVPDCSFHKGGTGDGSKSKWQVRTWSYKTDDTATEWYDSLPEAICVYALKLKGIDVEL